MSLIPGTLYTAPWYIQRPGLAIADGSVLLVLECEPQLSYDSENYVHLTGYYDLVIVTGDGMRAKLMFTGAALTYFKPAT